MKEITSKEYYDKVLGSWIGRVAGDFVGAPLELRNLRLMEKKYGEISDYPEPININYVNDDEMYEIVALVALEKYGIDLKAKDIAQEWLNLLTEEKAIFTAEKVALTNLRAKIWPPESGTRENPYFDYIGAQMRADLWGQLTPGCPDVTKIYTEIDGSISHAGIGIEGEVFTSILLSQSFFETDVRKIIDGALRYIPPESESMYTKIVRRSIALYSEYPKDFKAAREILVKEEWKRLKDELIEKEPSNKTERAILLKGKLGEVHVLPNAGIVVLSLLYGSQDREDPLGKSICTASMMGLDTDCNCGNVGAIVGAQIGEKKIPKKWKDPLQDTFSTYVKNHEKWKITELARRVAEMGKKIVKEKCKEVKIINCEN